MSDFIIDQNAVLQCAHAGMARATRASQRVKAGGHFVVTQPVQYSVSGCSLSGTSSPPCATATFVSAATRVRAGGEPVLIKSGQSTCTPTGTPLTVISTQIRVKAL